MDVGRIQAELRRFAAERDWDQFHTPKNLAMALNGEAGELAAEFQWLTPEQSGTISGHDLNRVRLEAADVGIYLLRLCDKLGIDLESAIHEKIRLNGQRYPADKVKGSARRATVS